MIRQGALDVRVCSLYDKQHMSDLYNLFKQTVTAVNGTLIALFYSTHGEESTAKGEDEGDAPPE